jgi:hypothetical protein
VNGKRSMTMKNSKGVRVNKEELLRSLEDVKAGLSQQDILEQSSCFAISEGRILTYNDDVAVRAPVKLGKITGAVQASTLLAFLRKMPDTEVTLSQGEGELVITGKRREAAVRMEAEIMLPVDQLEDPGKWRPLHPEFTEALSMVASCAGSDLSEFATACVHLTPASLEASTNFQMMRYRIKTRFKESSLVKKDAIKHVIPLNVIEASETQAWVHFRNATGLVISCRRFKEDFLDIEPHLAVKGRKATLPKGMTKDLECAEIVSSENADNNQVLVEIVGGKLRVKAVGVSGRYKARTTINYDGKPLAFLISPKMFKEITEKFNDCLIGKKHLKVEGDAWTYVASLGVPEKKEAADDED